MFVWYHKVLILSCGSSLEYSVAVLVTLTVEMETHPATGKVKDAQRRSGYDTGSCHTQDL